MIRIKNILLAAAVVYAAVSFTSCRQVEVIDPNLEIPGLGGQDFVMNETDEWLFENYVKPYNIDVQYRWETVQMYSANYSTKITPIIYSQVRFMMEAIRDIWFEPYKVTAGEQFVKELMPKTVVLIGSYEYVNGGIKLGQAEGGRKISLFGGNFFPEGYGDGLKGYIHTIQHEFGHILHQTKMYPTEFKLISTDYDSSGWYLITDETEVFHRGFVRNYARNGYDDDFVDTFSMILTYGRAWFDGVVAIAATSTINPSAAAQLREKERIIEEYLLSEWQIMLYDDPATGEKGLETLVQEAIAAVEAEIVNP